MSPQFAIQEQPEQPFLRMTRGGDAARFVKSHDHFQTKTLSVDTTEMIAKDQATQITWLQEELVRERALIAQYRDEWDSVRQTLQAARRQNEMLVKERDDYQKQTQQLRQKVSELETKCAHLKGENHVLSFLGRSVVSDQFPSLPALQPSLKEVVNKIGPFILERELRKGESGNLVTVYRKSDKASPFAMKLVNKSAKHNWEMIQRLDREVNVLKKMQHGNIIQLHDVLHGYRAFYLILEHADMNVREYQERFYPEQASCGWIKPVITGVTRAIAHLHNAKVAHLDIRPENILLVGIGKAASGSMSLLLPKQVRLSGFSSCAFQQDLTGMQKKSQYSFVAPDVVFSSNNSVDGAACDMWSLGATLLGMATGFCEGWMASYEQGASDVDVGERLQNIHDDRLSWHKDAYLKDLILERLLVPPATRATAEQVLQHKWLSSSKKEMMWV